MATSKNLSMNSKKSLDKSTSDKGMSLKKTLGKMDRMVKPPKTMAMEKESKSIEKATSKSKTITVKPTTDEKIRKNRKDYEMQTGKSYMSKDEHFNKLQKKLGRRPTIAEYNKSLK
jgi:hypothetical protein